MNPLPERVLLALDEDEALAVSKVLAHLAQKDPVRHALLGHVGLRLLRLCASAFPSAREAVAETLVARLAAGEPLGPLTSQIADDLTKRQEGR